MADGELYASGLFICEPKEIDAGKSRVKGSGTALGITPTGSIEHQAMRESAARA